MSTHIITAVSFIAAAILSIQCATVSSADVSSATVSSASDTDAQSVERAGVAVSQQRPHVASCSASLAGFKSWGDESVKPTAAMLCIHGLGLNSGAFDDFGTRMAHNGVLVFAFDVRGFGAWMKKEDGEKLDFQGSLNDIKQMLSAIRTDYPGLPVFLLGESMGGAIVLKACSDFPQLIDGLVSSAPGGERYNQERTDLEVGLRVLTGPRKQFDIGREIVDQATENPALRKVWLSDPLNRSDLSADQLIQFQRFMDGNDAAVRQIKTTPVLVLQGTLDKLVKPDDTWKIFTILSTERKTLIALRSEHLVLEYGRVKSAAYDTKTSNMVAEWMRDVSLKAADD